MRRLTMVVTAFALLGGLRAAADESAVVRTPVEFRVTNVNTSALPCGADGKPYVIRGELVRASRDAGDLVTVALHEFSFGAFFWSVPGHDAYDVAASMARAGHPWLVLDRLGYDRSDHPPGTATCLGAQADVIAQVVRAVTTGDYRFGPAAVGPTFRRVALVGHSVGAGIAELATHSFPTLPVAGLAVLGWADHSYSVDTVRQSVQQGADCAAGGHPAEPGTADGYAWFGRTPEQFQRNMFFDGEPAVIDAATALRNRDPCGDNASLARLAAVNRLRVSTIDVPVLLLFGERDPVFTTDAARRQAAAFSGSTEVVLHVIPRAAHALTLERAAPSVRLHLLRWLDARSRQDG